VFIEIEVNGQYSPMASGIVVYGNHGNLRLLKMRHS